MPRANRRPFRLSRTRDGERETDRNVVMALLAVAIFAGAASMRGLDALLPAIARDFGQTIGSTGAVVTAYALSYSLCQLFYGPLGDRVGAYRVIVWAALLSAAAALACGLASSLGWLIGLRFLAGGIAAAIGPLTLTWVSQATTAADRPIAVARVTSASIIGAMAGQVGGGLTGARFGWPSSFFMIAALFAGSGAALTWMKMRDPRLGSRAPVRESTDARGSSLHMLILRPAVRHVLIAAAVEGVAMCLSLPYLAGLLQHRLSVSMSVGGAIIALFGAGGIAFVFLARWATREFAERQRAAWGGSLAGGGFLLLTLSSSALMASVGLFVAGLGFFALHNVLQVRATRMAPDAPGAALSLFAATFFLAQALGAGIGGYAFDRFGPMIACMASAAAMASLGLAIAARGLLPAADTAPTAG